MNRRTITAVLLACASIPFAATIAHSQAYPNRPVRIVVGFAAGGTVDVITRIYAEKLSQHFKQQFIVENAPGGGSHIATATASRSQPDGYTLLLATNANSTGVSLYKKLNYSFPDDFEPISLLAGAPSALVVSKTMGVNSVQELIAAAKAKPNEISYGSAGVGTGTHMAAELFQMSTQTKLTHVPYRDVNGAILDMMGGRISVLFSPLGTVSQSIKDGRLKGLAVTTEKRTALAPELPTLVESGVSEFDVTLWLGLMAPKGTPSEILKSLASAVEEIQQSDDIKTRLANSGGEPVSGTLEAFATFIRKDVQTWAKVVEFAGVKID